MEMESSCSCSLTKQEFDAVLQLIQLSGCSSDDLRVLWLDFAVGKHIDGSHGGGGGAVSATATATEASSSISSSGSINEEEMLDGDDDEPLPRTNHKFGSLVDIYGKTTIRNRSKKRPRF